MMKNILKAGDRIQISSLKKNLAGEQGPVLMSRIADIEDSGELIVEMPMHQGKIILLSLGARYEFVFYTKRGPYRGTCRPLQGRKQFSGEGRAEKRAAQIPAQGVFSAGVLA